MNGPIPPDEIDRLNSICERGAWTGRQAALPTPIKLKTLAEFCREYVALAYASSLLFVHRRFTHSRRGQDMERQHFLSPGPSPSQPAVRHLGLEVTRGRVAFLTFENPDDVRMRL